MFDLIAAYIFFVLFLTCTVIAIDAQRLQDLDIVQIIGMGFIVVTSWFLAIVALLSFGIYVICGVGALK